MSERFNTKTTDSSTNEWLTPRWLLNELDPFDLDPCAAKDRPWSCAHVSYTVDDNSLHREWFGRVWLNPPYGKDGYPFLKRMAEEKHEGLALIFARTETKVMQELVLPNSRYIFLLKGRLRFLRRASSGGWEEKGTANAPSLLVAFCRDEGYLLSELERKGLGVLFRRQN